MSVSSFWVSRVFIATLAVTAVFTAAVTDACQRPPDNIPCRFDIKSPVVDPVDPFEVYLTIVNYPTAEPYPPPFLDDLIFDVAINGLTAEFDLVTETCISRFPPTPQGPYADPEQYSVRLDEAWSPYADEPTSHTQTITMTPDVIDQAYGVQAFVCGNDGGGPGQPCTRSCRPQLSCIVTSDDPEYIARPYAEFLDPVRTTAGGGSLPFSILVHRNGYIPGVPLTVQVTPENLSDPLDIFPVEPASLTTVGATVTGDDEVVGFQCTTHYPCFVGVENVYHVDISDGATLLWSSRWTSPEGMARAIVSRAPHARTEVVEVIDDGGDGRVATGEHAVIHLRLYGRNPSLVESLFAASVDLELPKGLLPADLVTVQSWQLHHHDNPMDTYDPTPTELAAMGRVTSTSDTFRVETDELVARFGLPPFTPPAVFHDLFEVELFLETPAEGIAIETDLTFATRFQATSGDGAVDETSLEHIVCVRDGFPPNRVPALYATRSGDDVRLVWNDPTVDIEHAAADRYRLYRAEGDATATWATLAEQVDDPAPREEAFDAAAVSAPLSYLYAVSAFNADGNSGDVP